MTTEHFTKIRAMNYPDGCPEWGPLEIDVRYSEWKAQRRTNRIIAAFMIAAVLLTAFSVAGSMGLGQ